MLQARVTSKSDIRTWNKASGSGKLFSMDLMDESGEIRATAFKDQCDQYYDYIQVSTGTTVAYYRTYSTRRFCVDKNNRILINSSLCGKFARSEYLFFIFRNAPNAELAEYPDNPKAVYRISGRI
jgi:hypothetical protein